MWDRSDIGTFVPTPAQYQGKLYFVRDKGELACVDPQTGKTFWTDALPKHRNAYYASPLIAGGNLYAIREDGVVFVVRLGDNREVLAEINMGEQIIASPVPSDGRLFLRGERHLFCVGG